MKKILVLIAILFFFSCEKNTPFEEDRKKDLETDREYYKRRLWCENDTTVIT